MWFYVRSVFKNLLQNDLGLKELICPGRLKDIVAERL